jgi:putative Ca2+/H+ antiporter (TMEM165/GDT1 family)
MGSKKTSMNLEILLASFGLVFLAELGDKTQLVAVALAARLPWRRVFVGIAAAFVLLNAVAVGVGEALFALVPLGWIQLASSLLFAAFGLKTLFGPEAADGLEEEPKVRRGPVATAFILILLAELGDKTQLVIAGLAAQHGAPVTVFVGATLALWTSSLLGLLVGSKLSHLLPAKWIHRAAGVAFLAFAVVAAVSAAKLCGWIRL